MFVPAEQRTTPCIALERAAERVIVIRGTHYNVDLRELHDSLFGTPDPEVIVRFVLAPGARILSRSEDLPAMRTGLWPKAR